MAGWDLDCLEQPFIPEVITNIIFYGCYDRKKVRKHDIENLKQPTMTVVMCSYGIEYGEDCGMEMLNITNPGTERAGTCL